VSDKTSIWCHCENSISQGSDYCINCGRKIAHPKKADCEVKPVDCEVKPVDCEIKPTEIIYPKKLSLNEWISKYRLLTAIIFVALVMFICFLINPSDFKFNNVPNQETDISNMSNKEFNQYWNDLNKRQQERIDNQKAFPDK